MNEFHGDTPFFVAMGAVGYFGLICDELYLIVLNILRFVINSG